MTRASNTKYTSHRVPCTGPRNTYRTSNGTSLPNLSRTRTKDIPRIILRHMKRVTNTKDKRSRCYRDTSICL
ncbi:hypothetical protein B0T09DRAFT_146130 [Sordaria sp. MPI-SDFR-AT-0083]|nr:hypothetical protein B0T09DRAFT_146130 [Sordaria sp. MPI-SDFR-AT-0083]